MRSELRADWDLPPWWRALTLRGWAAFLFGSFATVALLAGFYTGQVLFIASSKQKSGPIDVSFFTHPFWFIVCMIANAVIAAVTWYRFFFWLRNRRMAHLPPSRSRVQKARRATREDGPCQPLG